MIQSSFDKPYCNINSYFIFGLLEHLIFIFYLVVFCSIFYYSKIHKDSGLSVYILLFLFVLKISAGCLNLYIHCHEYLTNDVLFYHEQSLLELQKFQGRPLAFLSDFFFNWGNFSEHCNMLSRENMRYWSDLGVLIHVKYMNLANLFTGGNLYVNVIFFNVIYFLGSLYLYKLFYLLQPRKKWMFVFSVFLVPSVLFWCSGIHKDGWVLAAIGFSLFTIMKFHTTQKRKYLFWLSISLLLLLLSRYFVFFCFFPPLMLWFFYRKTDKGVLWFAITYIVLLILFFTVGNFTPFEPLDIIIAKQQSFFSLRGYSDMQTSILDHHVSSFVANFPEACNHIFLRPYYNSGDLLKYQVAAIDSWLVCALYILCALYIRRGHVHQLFYMMLLVFALSMYLFIGYTIPNCGALVRYKSEFTVILLSAMFALSEIPFLKGLYAKPDETNELKGMQNSKN